MCMVTDFMTVYHAQMFPCIIQTRLSDYRYSGINRLNSTHQDLYYNPVCTDYGKGQLAITVTYDL